MDLRNFSEAVELLLLRSLQIMTPNSQGNAMSEPYTLWRRVPVPMVLLALS
jgi:hypothetical protein